MVLFYIIYMVVKYNRSDLQSLPKRKPIDIILKLQETITQMENTILYLEERIRQVEGKIHQDSHNSHIRPSQFNSVVIKNLKETDREKRGWSALERCIRKLCSKVEKIFFINF